jgi:thioester reductase-like protein
MRWRDVREVVETVSHIAAVASIVILIIQIRSAASDFSRSLEEAKVDRSAQWVLGLVEPTAWQSVVKTDAYLGNPTIADGAKLSRIAQDAKFREDFLHTLAVLELIGYMYNADKIDKELVRRGPSAAIAEYFHDSKFWSEYNRRQTGDSTFQRELETMVLDLRRTPADSGAGAQASR